MVVKIGAMATATVSPDAPISRATKRRAWRLSLMGEAFHDRIHRTHIFRSIHVGKIHMVETIALM